MSRTITFTTLLILLLSSATARNFSNGLLSSEPCSPSHSCKSPRKCVDQRTSAITGIQVACLVDSGACRCQPTQDCHSSSDCERGERCLKIDHHNVCSSCKTPEVGVPIDDAPENCETTTTSQTPSVTSLMMPTEEPELSTGPSTYPEELGERVCISIDALKDFKMDELVFPDHRRAAVLCDASQNCATPGHIITYKNQPMMMSKYCETFVSCTRHIKYVNSPRMQFGLRIASNSEQLKYTALASTYETKLEEQIIKILILLGV